MRAVFFALVSLSLGFGLASAAWGSAKPGLKATSARGEAAAERRLLDIYELVAAARSREALASAELLVRDHPNFQLAQLVYGDLLAARSGPITMLGDVQMRASEGSAVTLAAMREEALLRLRAHRELAPAGTMPSQFVQLSASQRHAIAIDTAKARLYLFENGPAGLKLVEHFYVSVGKLGVGKAVEGDQRTPLGVYFVVSNLDPKTLRDFYGAGALPINYPNRHDIRSGRTGRGIWIHGAPPGQFARAPKASDGCVVLANPDLSRILRTVDVGTPVVIAQSLQWLKAPQLESPRLGFRSELDAWRQAKETGDMARLRTMYVRDAIPAAALGAAVKQGARGPGDLSLLSWKEGSSETMVVTFNDGAATAASSGQVRRQYWTRDSGSWKIFYDGVIRR
ncbi:L,D-transpeptidase [Caenimonas sedimenti]|uniref:L,D-transpeptidase n=1 Tax=Caenimonas sedimenti TaxID=2596921 RepID=A0A562ZEB9_9BURK|nr:L,D-transpeptidase [Caenimonas sedimenti]TWO64420.1 L,D-transpeptidase [Caenimonas sedimenti]